MHPAEKRERLVGVRGTGEGGVPVLPVAERLVNLTPHEIVLRASELPDRSASPGGGGEGHVAPTVIRLPPAGRLARVDDDDARRGRAA